MSPGRKHHSFGRKSALPLKKSVLRGRLNLAFPKIGSMVRSRVWAYRPQKYTDATFGNRATEAQMSEDVEKTVPNSRPEKKNPAEEITQNTSALVSGGSSEGQSGKNMPGSGTSGQATDFLEKLKNPVTTTLFSIDSLPGHKRKMTGQGSPSKEAGDKKSNKGPSKKPKKKANFNIIP